MRHPISTPLDARPGHRSFVRILLLIGLFALILRVAYILGVQRDPVAGDGDYYFLIAHALVDGRGFTDIFGSGAPDAAHPPAWSVALALPTWLGQGTQLDLQLFSCLVGTLTVLAVGFAGRAVGGVRVGWIAAFLAAVYPGFWIYERDLLSETLLLLGVALTVWAAYRYRATPTVGRIALLGALVGLVTLTRSEQIMLALFLIVPLVFVVDGWRDRILHLGVAAIAVILVLAPWVISNLGRFEEPVTLSTGMGQAMLVGACDSTFDGELVGYFDSQGCLYTQSLGYASDTSVRDRLMREAAVEYSLDHADRLPLVVLTREARVWGLYRPLQQVDLITEWSGTKPWVFTAFFASTLLLMIPAIGGVVVLRRRGIAVYPLLAFFIPVVITVAITFGEARYHAASDVSLVILAAASLDALVARWSHRARDEALEAHEPELAESR